MKKQLLLILSLCVSVMLQAQVNFSPFVYNYDTLYTSFVPATFSSRSVGNDPCPVDDYNGDGNADIILTNINPYHYSGLFIYYGKGDGRFSVAQKIFEDDNNHNFDFVNKEHIGDFNGDGRKDILMHNKSNSGDTIWILFNNGDGTFSSTKKSYIPEDNLHSLTTGDFNNDGKVDFVCSNSDSNYIYLGNGDGSFAPASLVNHSTENFNFDGDFNGDNKIDICYVHSDTYDTKSWTFTVLLGNGDGTFATSIKTTIASNCVQEQIIKGDFNNDGIIDLAICDQSQFMKLILGNGDGTFTMKTISDKSRTNFYYAAVGDFNNDGKADIIQKVADSISLQLGNGDGSFKKHFNIPDLRVKWFSQSFSYGDFNGDGKTDLIGVVQKEGSYDVGLLVMINKPQFEAPIAINSIQKFPYQISTKWTTYNTLFTTGFLIEISKDVNFVNIIDVGKLDLNFNHDTLEYNSYKIISGINDYYYRIKAYNANDTSKYSNTIHVVMNNQTAVSEVNNDFDVIYPNPTSEGINIQTKEKSNVSIFNINSNLVLSAIVSGTKYIQTTSFPTGIYFVKITNDNLTSTHKLIIKH